MQKKKVSSFNNDIAISINNLFVIYNEDNEDYKLAVNNFSFDFKRGKNYCIIGQSGSGKSSIISSLNGLFKPRYGYISIFDEKLVAKKTLVNVVIAKHFVDTVDKKNKFLLFVSKKSNFVDVYNYVKSITNEKFELKKGATNFEKSNLLIDKRCILYTIVINDNLNSIPDYSKLDKEQIPSCILDKKYIKKVKNYNNIHKIVGMVYQFPEYQLFKSTILGDASFGARNLKIKKELAIEKAKECLLKLNIPDNKFNDSPFDLSGGQKRRVALAGIFAINPLIYIFDEPTAGLDPMGEQEMINYMLDLKKDNKTLIVITHSMDEVLSIADEVLVIHDGALMKHGDPYDVFLDEEILSKTNIIEPHVISIIKKLINKNSKFKILLDLKPKNVFELSQYLTKILKDKNVK